MAEEQRSLRTVFSEAEAQRKRLEAFASNTGAAFQENLAAAVEAYRESSRIADQISLFSPNETLDDISSGDLQFLLIDYHLAELGAKQIGGDRKSHLLEARSHYERFLKQLDNYDILSKDESKLFEEYTENPDDFSTASKTDAAARRATKISRFKQEKDLKGKLEFLRQTSTEEDSDVLRQLQLDHIHLSVHKTFDALESIAQELQILKMARPSPPSHPQAPVDQRQRNGHADGYSERLDDLSRLSRPGGPILDGQGKPLRPFTLLDKRTQFREGVFRPDHNLPTMTIDEYLEEERRRGGIIEGGGPQSGLREQVDEDDMDKADEETMKARAWDEFKEANPRGSGNTLNKG